MHRNETEDEEEMSDSGDEEMMDNSHAWEAALCALFQKQAEKAGKGQKGRCTEARQRGDTRSV